uniref:IS5/IS1182 family transposase n=2 Tax=Schistosoma mansoni TaxID=6183 RepID=A0A3Q0KQR1_SCHMA
AAYSTSAWDKKTRWQRFRIWLQLVLEFLCCLLDIEYRNNRIN